MTRQDKNNHSDGGYRGQTYWTVGDTNILFVVTWSVPIANTHDSNCVGLGMTREGLTVPPHFQADGSLFEQMYFFNSIVDFSFERGEFSWNRNSLIYSANSAGCRRGARAVRTKPVLFTSNGRPVLFTSNGRPARAFTDTCPTSAGITSKAVTCSGVDTCRVNGSGFGAVSQQDYGKQVERSASSKIKAIRSQGREQGREKIQLHNMANSTALVFVGPLCVLWLCVVDWSCSQDLCPSGFYLSRKASASICRMCRVCPEGLRVKAPCTANTNTQCSGSCRDGFFLSGNGSSTCQRCTRCETGTFVLTPCVENTNTVCVPCPEGTFSSTRGQLQCTACRETCSPGQHERRPCSRKHDTVCRDCNRWSYSPSGKTCHPCTPCPAGSGLKTPCNMSSDAECQQCPSGSYSPGDQSPCRTCSACRENQTTVSSCLSFRDTVCFPCPEGRFFHAATLQCQQCTVCPPGTVQQTECTATNDSTCFPCPRGTFSSADGRTCSNCSTCPEGKRVTSQCAGDRDTVCRPCRHGTYLSPDGDCLPCTYCPAGMETAQQCTSSANRRCSECEKGHWSPGHGFPCRTCSLCRAGHFVWKPCTGRGDTECRQCQPGTYTHTDTSRRECLPCGKCTAPNVTLKACQADHDVRCGLCVSGHFVDTEMGRCLRCSYCFPGHPGLAVREDGCRSQPRDWQCRPLVYTSNVSGAGLKKPSFVRSASGWDMVTHQYKNLDQDSAETLIFIVVPVVVGVMIICTLAVVVCLTTRRKWSRLSEQSVSSKTTMTLASASASSAVKSWLMEQEAGKPSAAFPSHSWPTIVVHFPESAAHAMSVVSCSAVSQPHVLYKLEERGRLRPKPIGASSEEESDSFPS
ncbi:uncharacterized protein LOC143283798 [Babylonia areolata]|uniref:uncharacterized protein LOC143283798 n=1 Tax=Babylonia areolata TaxID=304850 RepID=UPI003FD0C31E